MAGFLLDIDSEAAARQGRSARDAGSAPLSPGEERTDEVAGAVLQAMDRGRAEVSAGRWRPTAPREKWKRAIGLRFGAVEVVIESMFEFNTPTVSVRDAGGAELAVYVEAAHGPAAELARRVRAGLEEPSKAGVERAIGDLGR